MMIGGPKTIVVLHGWGQSRGFWNEFSGRFAEDEVIALDLPGFGNEPLISSDWGIPEYAVWATKKIASLEKDNIVLLGHSFGGRISGLIASERPTWLKGVILYGAPCLYRPKASTRVIIGIAKILKRAGFRGKYANEELRVADRTGMGAIFRKAVGFDETQLLPNIAVPTLLVWGANDEVEAPRRIAEEMHSLISSSRLVIMDGAGHNAHLENPTFFYGIVKKFIDSI